MVRAAILAQIRDIPPFQSPNASVTGTKSGNSAWSRRASVSSAPDALKRAWHG
jgi:hypothetical protein